VGDGLSFVAASPYQALRRLTKNFGLFTQ